MFWEDHNLVLEYLGEKPHSQESRVLSDRARTNALQHMGYTVKEITREQIANYEQFEVIALDIAKLFGKRIPYKYRGALPQRLALRNELFSWNQAFGRPTKR